MKKDIPLIVPEVNPDDLSKFRKKKIIANPNCSTIQMVLALKPIHDLFNIKKLLFQPINPLLEQERLQWMNYFIKLWMYIKINP